MPEIEDAMAARRTEKTRTVHHIGAALENRLQEQRVFTRVVFEVRVLDDDDIAGRFANAAGDGGAFALIVRLQQHANTVAAIEFRENIPRAVGGAVVNDDQLFLHRREIDTEYAG